jgi:tetratricopeptide (TPR) repeat protein
MKSISKLLLWNSVFRAYALLFSQDPKNIIEVRRLLRKAITTIKKSNNDRDRSVDLLAALAFSYIQENSKTAWQYAEQYTAEAIEIISKQQAKEPDKNSYKLKLAYELKVLSTCRHMKRHPDWNGALADVSQAIKIFREEKDYDGLAHALHQRAWIALANPNRISTDNAIRDCREALGLLASRKDREDRAVILDQLADCLINHTEPPEWTEGMRCMEESVEILLDLKSDIALEKVSDLFDLYIHKPDPEWQKAALLCDIAVRLTPAKDHAIRSFQYYSKARCLLNQGSIDWIEATKASQQGLREARKADSAALLINSLLQLGFICLEQDPPRFNDATGIYTELTQLLVGAKNAELRASALHNLAFSLIHSSRPNVPRAYAACNEAIAILSALPKRSSSEALNLTHLLAADIELMGSDTTPKVAIKHYMEALKLLKSPASRVDRAIVLNHLSFVHYNFEPRDLDSAVKASKSAVRIMQKQWEGSGEQEKKILSENLSNMMGQLASIYAMTTPPQHEKAINLYREALRFMSEPEQYRLRGDTLRLLAYSYWFKSAPSIDQAVLALMEAAECFRKCEATESLKAVLPEIALTLTLQQPPAPEEALAVCRQAEPLLNEDVDIESKIRIVRLIVTCELMRIDPDLENAEEAANHSITLLEKYKASAGQSKSLGLDEELDEARAILKFVQEKRSGSSLALSKQGQAGFHRAGQADSERTDGEL